MGIEKMIREIIRKYKYCLKANRIGPDMPFTHWKLHFKSSMLKLCKKKFYHFADTAEFRAGAYAIGCSQISIGERVVIRPQTMLFGETLSDLPVSIIIEDDVLMGSVVHIYLGDHKFDNINIPMRLSGRDCIKPIKINDFRVIFFTLKFCDLKTFSSLTNYCQKKIVLCRVSHVAFSTEHNRQGESDVRKNPNNQPSVHWKKHS